MRLLSPEVNMPAPMQRLAVLGVGALLLALSPQVVAAGEDCAGSGFAGLVHTVVPGGVPDLLLELRGIAAAAAIEVRDTTSESPDAPGYVFIRHLACALQRGEFGFGFAPGAYFQCHARAVVDEQFVLEGPPPGTDVVVLLRLEIETRVDRVGSCGPDCELTVSSRIDSPAGVDEAWRDFRGLAGLTVATWTRDVLVPVRSGASFALRFVVSANSPDAVRSVDTAVRWSFPDLAPGSGVRACLGGGMPTPALVASWGELKAHYR